MLKKFFFYCGWRHCQFTCIIFIWTSFSALQCSWEIQKSQRINAIEVYLLPWKFQLTTDDGGWERQWAQLHRIFRNPALPPATWRWSWWFYWESNPTSSRERISHPEGYKGFCWESISSPSITWLRIIEEEAGGGSLLCSGRKANTFWDLTASDYPNSTVVMAVEGRNNQKKMCEKNTMWDHLWSIIFTVGKRKAVLGKKNNSKDLRLEEITVWGVMNIQ